jgi:hypothetical protein
MHCVVSWIVKQSEYRCSHVNVRIMQEENLSIWYKEYKTRLENREIEHS